MLLVRGNLKARIARATDDEERWSSEYLSFPDTRFTSRGRKDRNGNPPRLAMLNALDKTFPAGLVPLLVSAGATAGHTIQVLDKRTRPCTPDPTADLEWLRHHPATDQPVTHQIEAVQSVVQHERGILWLPTGSGKTEIAIGLTRALPCRWLFLVDNRTLLHQAAERYLARTGSEAGVVGDDEWTVHDRFTVAMFQTLAAALRKKDPRAMDLLLSAEGLCVDECHIQPAESFMRVTQSTPHAYYRVGLSGTPLARGDQKSILAIGAIGPVIYRVRPAELQALGILSTGTVNLIPCEQTLSDDATSWQEVYGELIVESAVRNKLLVDIAVLAPKPALLFVKEVNHGKRLEKMLAARGIQAEFVWGSDSSGERAAAIRRLERGDVDVLVCSVIFNKGIDIPCLASGINGAAGASIIAAIQKLGRTTRATDEKSTFAFFDIADDGDKWMRRHARARVRAYVSEGHTTINTTLRDLRGVAFQKKAG